jgi:hypothetical protein
VDLEEHLSQVLVREEQVVQVPPQRGEMVRTDQHIPSLAHQLITPAAAAAADGLQTLWVERVELEEVELEEVVHLPELARIMAHGEAQTLVVVAVEDQLALRRAAAVDPE